MAYTILLVKQHVKWTICGALWKYIGNCNFNVIANFINGFHKHMQKCEMLAQSSNAVSDKRANDDVKWKQLKQVKMYWINHYDWINRECKQIQVNKLNK